MSGLQQQSDETKRKLVAATKTVLADQGWSAVSNRVIAERSGVNLALISYHFGSKSGLLAAAVDSAVDGLTQRMNEMGDFTSLGDFASVAVASIEDMRRDVDSRVLAASMLEATHNADVAAAVSRNLREFRSALRRIATESATPHGAGRAILVAALIDGLLLHALVDPSTDLKVASEAALSLFEPATA